MKYVLVVPANEMLLKLLRHPDPSVQKFGSLDIPVAWPEDQFTIRRIMDGDVVKQGDAPPQKAAHSGPQLPTAGRSMPAPRRRR